MSMRSTIALIVFILTTSKIAQAHSSASLEMDHSWIKAPIPGTMMTGGFISITNNGNKDDHLIAVYSDLAKKVELHAMTMVDGVMRMRAVTGGWTIPAGETLKLESGGKHIMIMGLQKMIKEGDVQMMVLKFKEAGAIKRNFVVHAPTSTSNARYKENEEPYSH